MEQKKILWIIVAISAFVLIIFGTALFLYAPSRTSVASREAAISSQGSGTASQQGIDPDSWVRDPNKAPNLDSTAPDRSGDINLTIVNGDNAGANYGTMDVSGLTNGKQIKQGDLVAPAPQGIPGQDTGITGQKADETAGVSQASTETTKVTTTTVTTDKTVKSGTTQKTTVTGTAKATDSKAVSAKAKTAKAKPAQTAKAIAVTEYWIQAGSFSSKLNAEKARESLTARYLNAEIFTKEQGGKTSFRVRVGPYKTKTEAEYWLGTIAEAKDFAGSYVSEVKAKK